MPLNIKDEKIHEAAKQLARLTGQTITGAVRLAIMEQLERVETQSNTRRTGITAEAILTLGRECAASMKSEANSKDHAELYGTDGLPI